ncbi:MAG: diaminopropionate ammonia-lyase [Clostridia bacterium]|nr:diaminopropionate ammonia-lyase [Clostridia bacterium]
MYIGLIMPRHCYKYRDKARQIEFVTCTDGNHGRGVSWAAGLFGCKAHVFMPCGSQEIRAEAIRKVGPADVVITDLSYDDTVRYAKDMSEQNGWILIQDTAWDGYEKIPTWIIQGYLTLASELKEQLDELSVCPTHVFLQAGVGAMAGGMLGYLTDNYKEDKPITAIVEPEAADCIYASARVRDGKAHSVDGIAHTMMAGLNCGTPCKVTWPILRDYAEFYISCGDSIAALGMRSYAAGLDEDSAVISGESGAVTLGAAQRILADDDLAEVRDAMRFSAKSVILLINTEGDTDPENYKRIIHATPQIIDNQMN